MCSLCLHTPCLTNCPNYTPPKTNCICDICDQGIYSGEEYLENQDGEYAHLDCFRGQIHMIEWLGFKLKTMEEDYEEYD